MKNTIILGMLMILGVACKGPEGGPGMQMTTCDIDKNTVREIVTGESKSCGIVKAAITTEEAEEELASTWLEADNGNHVVAVRDEIFWTVQILNNKVIAFKGNVFVGDSTDTNTISAITVFDAHGVEGFLTFEEDTLTVETDFDGETQTTTYLKDQVLDLTLTDEDIIIVTTTDELQEVLNNL